MICIKNVVGNGPQQKWVKFVRCKVLSIALFLVAQTKTLEKMDAILTKVRFLLFLQRFNLSNTPDLVVFMLRRVLSITSWKLLCCHKAILHRLKCELTCGSFQLYIWQQNLQQICSFTPLL